MFLIVDDKFVVEDLRAYSLAFRNIFTAYERGWHIVIMPAQLLDGAIESADWGDQTKSALRRIKENLPQYRGWAKDAEVVTHIVKTEDDEILDGFNDVIQCSIDILSNSEALLRTRFLVENAHNDGGALDLMLQSYLRKCNYEPVTLELVHGGGGTTARQYESHIRKHSPVYCLCDSDKTSPDSRMGETAKLLVKIDRKADHRNETFFPIRRLRVLEFREMENLIPLPLVRECYSALGNRTVVGRIDELSSKLEVADAGRAKGREFLRHFCMKRGISCKSISDATNQKSKRFLVNLWATLETGLDHNCSKTVDCEHMYAHNGISSNLLSRVIDYCATHPSKKTLLDPHFDSSPFSTEIEDLMSEIFAWAAHLDPVST